MDSWGENIKKDIPLFYKPKSQENEALGPSKKRHTAAELPDIAKHRFQPGMDARVDSSKTLMERVVWLVL